MFRDPVADEEAKVPGQGAISVRTQECARGPGPHSHVPSPRSVLFPLSLACPPSRLGPRVQQVVAQCWVLEGMGKQSHSVRL